MSAAAAGHLDVVRALLQGGAELNVMTDKGATALKFAEDNGHPDVVEFLKSAGGVTTDEEFAAIDRIVVLPVVDARTDKRANIKLDGLRKYEAKILESRHYAAVEQDTPPPDARWVMVMTVKDLHYGAPGIPVATVDGILCDMQGKDHLPICGGRGSKLWSGEGTGQFRPLQPTPQANLNNAMMDATSANLTNLTWEIFGLAKGDALTSAVANLLNSIPKQPKKKK
jgi:hypothetical protein